MKRLLVMGLAVLAATLTLGSSPALADIDVVLQVENRTTGQVGSDVSASAGDRVAITLLITNNGPRQMVDIEVVGGMVGCLVEVETERRFAAGQTRRKRMQGRVPEGHTGTFFVEVSAEGDDGCSGSDTATVQLGASKAANAEPSAGLMQRMFVRMMARGLLDGIANDNTPVPATFGELKGLFR